MCGCIYYLYDDDNLEEALHVLIIVYVPSDLKQKKKKKKKKKRKVWDMIRIIDLDM